jgi:molecular chaperone HscB
MICWSCEREAGSGPACAPCGALQPPDAAADHFAVLGVPARYALDVAALEARFKDLSRKLHPDRFARADPRARRASLARTVQLNEAWRALKDPVRRAEYMLERAGVKVAAGEVPPALLAEILELREELGEARLADDHAKVRKMAEAMRARAGAAMGAIAAALDAGTPEGLAAAARELVAFRYFRRFLDEVDAHEEAQADRAAGAGEAGADAG